MKNHGISLIEIVISTALIAIMLSAASALLIGNIKIPKKSEKILLSSALAGEAEAALRSLRHGDWLSLQSGLAEISQNEGRWSILPAIEPRPINGFFRRIEIMPVYRGRQYDIIGESESGAWLDPLSRQALIDVYWEDGFGEHGIRREVLLSAWSSPVFLQDGWNGGDGQAVMGDSGRYYSAENIDDSSGVSLSLATSSIYFENGWLESSVIEITGEDPLALAWRADTEPSCAGCSIRLQIKTARDQGGSPVDWSPEWCGPDGEDGDKTDYYASAGGEAISLDHAGDKWFKYKAWLAGSGEDTPRLVEVKLFYQ